MFTFFRKFCSYLKLSFVNLSKFPFLVVLRLFLANITISFNEVCGFKADGKSSLKKCYEKKHKVVKDFLSVRYGYILDKYEDEIKWIEAKEDDSSSPIWMFWWQGEDVMPELCSVCYKSVKKSSAGRKVNLVTKYNYKEYFDMPQEILDKVEDGRFCIANFADIYRTCLIAKYGGIWLDCTVLLKGMIDDKWFGMPFISAKLDCGSDVFVSDSRWMTFFIGGFKGSPFFMCLNELLLEYGKREDAFIDYLVIDYFINLVMERFSLFSREWNNFEFGNAGLYDLLPIMNEAADNVEFAELWSENFVFKLSYKFDFKEENNGKQTVWRKVKDWNGER